MSILSKKPKSILFVCLGNICRSPTAHGVFDSMLKDAGITNQITVDSAGTAAYHVGHKLDGRMMRAAKHRGIDLSYLRARAVHPSDFEIFDLILAMDKANYDDLNRDCPDEFKDKVKMFLTFASNSTLKSVPDPYYGGPEGFEEVLDLVEDACSGLFKFII